MSGTCAECKHWGKKRRSGHIEPCMLPDHCDPVMATTGTIYSPRHFTTDKQSCSGFQKLVDSVCTKEQDGVVSIEKSR